MKKEKKDRFEELASGYVLNALTSNEISEFEDMLRSAGPDEKKLFRELRDSAASMALVLEDAEPSANIKEKLMKDIATDKEQNAIIHSLPDQGNKFRYAIAASFIFVFATIAMVFYAQSLQTDLGTKVDTIAEQETTIRQLNSELERKNELLAILESRDVDLVLMAGQQVNPGGYGKVVWDKDNGQALLQIANLPLITNQNDYQLWFIKDGQPISAGIFGVRDSARDNFFKIEDLKESADQGAFAITLEPGGGSPQPTGDMYLLGELGS